ncbi:MAG: GGDEF domain-containing protein [Myxococcota bacterium]|nr:GGDEF domain-containing protein [Myxococcota bacterium]
MVHSLSQRLVARYFAVLLATSGVVSAIVHPLPNLTDMSGAQRAAITTVCLLGAVAIWVMPWDRWSRRFLLLLPPVGFGVKMWANLLGGLGPYSYSIHFVLIYVWMGIALPRGAPLAFAPLMAVAYAIPLALKGDPKQSASVAMVLPICVLIGESVAWISNRLREAEQADGRRMRRMRWLVEASAELAHIRDRRELSECLVRLANELPAADGAAVLLPASDRALELAAHSGWRGELPVRFELGETPALVDAMRGGDILGQESESTAALAARLGVARLGVAPLLGSSRCMGIVLLARRAGAVTLDDFTQDLVRTLSVQAGLAIERVRDREALHDETRHDALTGLGNRRKAAARLEALEPGDALVVLDLDHFKRVNDTLGHAGGDDVLRELSRFLARSLRDGDEAYRMGGEEFLVVLRQAGPDARIAGERLCEGWRHEDPVTTFSAGIAVHASGQEPADTLERADAALYEAKRAGRDRVVLTA